MSNQAAPSDAEPGQSSSSTPTLFLSSMDLTSLSQTQKGFILSIRSLEEEIAQTQMPGTDVKSTIAEMFPPAVLFSPDLMSLPYIHRKLRDWLDSHGANMSQHSSRRIIMTLATNLYDEAEDREAAETMARARISQLRSGGENNTPSQPTAPLQASSSHLPSREHDANIAHKVAMRFKDDKRKFSGAIEEYFNDYVSDYLQAARDYELTPTQKLQLLHNILTGDAKRFYYNRIEGYAAGYSQAVTMLEAEYNSVVRQDRCKNYLSSLRLARFVEEGLEVSTALEKTYRVITKLSPQVPQSHRGEAHKVEFLRKAVIGYDWATEPLSRIATHRLTFQNLYSELESALHLAKEGQLARIGDSISGGSKKIDDVAGILYQSQGRYLNKHAGLRTRNPPSWKGQGHPINIARAAKRRLEYYSKKQNRKASHQVLYELCSQLDNSDIFFEVANDSPVAKELKGLTRRPSLENRRLDETEEPPIEEIYACSAEELETFSSSSTKDFEGACVDTGAQKVVVGKPQANAYCQLMNSNLEIRAERRDRLFRFGSQSKRSLGTLEFRIPISDDFFISFAASVVDLDIPLLLGLDVMSDNKMVVDVGDNVLFSKSHGWKLPLTRKLGHIYVTWNQDILYTSAELTRIHRHFFHPHPDRLFGLMKRANDPDATPDTHKQLKDITSSCDICQRLAKEPSRFRVALPSEDIVFNRTVYMDLTKLDSEQCLHIVDKDTLLSAAAFLSEGETTDDVWHAYMCSWVIPYIGYSQKIHADQGPQFTSDRWGSLLRDAGIERDESGVESHNALGSGERYHAFLKQIYKKGAELPNISKDYALSLTVKAMNETAGPNGLSPVLLVFGVHPRMPLPTMDLPKQRERMKALKLARSEMVKAIAKSRIGTARKSNVPGASDSLIEAGTEVLVYREGPKEWTGPYRVVSVDKKRVVLDIKNQQKVYSIDKVKQYMRPVVVETQPQSSSSPQKPDLASQATPTSRQDQPFDFGAAMDRIIASDIFFTDIHNFIKRSKKDCKFSEEDSGNEVRDTYLTEILKPGDEREFTKEFSAAKQKEVDGLLERGTFRQVKVEEVSTDANILGGRFVCAIKNKGTEKEKAKARYVAQGHKDKEKPYIVHNITTLRQSSVKILVSTCAVMNFRIFSHDVTQAYLQSEEKLSREVYLKPRKEDLGFFKIDEGQLLQLIRALYGISDAGDYWSVTFDRHVRQDLRMKPLETDPSLYVKYGDEDIHGLLGAYVDDCILGGDEDFQALTEGTLQKFESRPREWDHVEFLGVNVNTSWIDTESGRKRLFDLGQPEHLAKVTKVPLDVSFDRFRSIRASFGWLAHSRPDVCCAINRAAQVTLKNFDKRHIQELNKAIQKVRSSLDLRLKYGPLDRNSLHIRAYTDASFASNDDHSSQLGYVILLCDAKDRCHFLDFASKKCKRVVRSIMAGEIYAFAEGFDGAFAMKYTMERIYGQRIPITMLTDSKQMFDVITKASHTSEKRLMIDIAASREAYNQHEISNVGLVLSEHNLADGLTKVKHCASLTKSMKCGFDQSPVQQWIFRST